MSAPPLPQTENLIRNGSKCIYVWKGRYLSFICALLSYSWVPLVEGAMSSRSCIVPPTLIQFLIAFLFLGKFHLCFSQWRYICALVCGGGVSMTPNFTVSPFLITGDDVWMWSVLCGMSRETWRGALEMTAVLTPQLLTSQLQSKYNWIQHTHIQLQIQYTYTYQPC